MTECDNPALLFIQTFKAQLKDAGWTDERIEALSITVETSENGQHIRATINDGRVADDLGRQTPWEAAR